MILGIESSCDECSASVIKGESAPFEVLSLSTFSQVQLHQPFGGVVPEVASRNHLETINLIVDEALKTACVEMKQIDAIAVTNRPGLVGALLVGVTAAKTLAYVYNKPLVPVHHLEGHCCSLFLEGSQSQTIKYPLLLAMISGGHTQLHVVPTPPEIWANDFMKATLVGRSRDDAAGEAFDKTAKMLGFPYPGGVWIDRESKNGNPEAFRFPRALPQKDILDFSFSGLKTAVSLVVQDLQKKKKLKNSIPDLCASIQEAIVDSLSTKIILAAQKFDCRSIAIVGGVAANSRLRAVLLSKTQIPVFSPELKYCTDNAAMIAAAGAVRFFQKKALGPEQVIKLNAFATAEF